MKIGIDVTPLPPDPVGAGTYIIQLVRALSALPTDHRFVVFAQRSGRKQFGALGSSNFEWVIEPDHSPAMRLVWEQIRLPRLAAQFDLDLLHSLHYTRPFALPCASVVTFHDMTFFLFPELHTRSKRLFFPWAIRMSARRADALIAVSESTRRDALRILGLAPDKIVAIPNGISGDFRPVDDPALLEPCRQKYRLPGEFILFVGVIEPRKNLPLLLRAYASLATRESPAGLPDLPPLVLVGQSGWMVADLLALIKQLGLEQKIQLTGYIPGQDLPIVYNLAQVFVYPSVYEGFGFPPLEAMACGTPVITTANSAMLDYVGDAGLLVPPKDERALSQAIETLLSNPMLQQRLSHEGRRRAAKFTWERTAIRTLEVYEKVGMRS
jgi:glycosyltransferase involved in cell wall biosynthesis